MRERPRTFEEPKLAPLDPVKVARMFDVPPWIVGIRPAPRFARLRWRLRRAWPGGVWR